MKEFTIKDMSDLLYALLAGIQDKEKEETETVLQTPTTRSKFPCRVINTPIESIRKTNQAIPLLKTFQVQIEHWSEKQRESMEMSSKTDLALREKNFVKSNTTPIMFDEITKKYRLITTYEVTYNAITNAFEMIR